MAALAGLAPGCNCSKKADDTAQIKPSIIAPKGGRDASEPPPFKPMGGGVEKFTAPQAEEVLSVSTSPDGETLLAVTAKSSGWVAPLSNGRCQSARK